MPRRAPKSSAPAAPPAIAPAAAPPPADTIVVSALALVYALVYGAVCLNKYRNYLYRDFDLAIFAQATNGILHGNLFSSIRGMPWLGDHTSLILFLLAPVYALFRDARTLLIIQTVAMAAGALPVHRLAWAAIGRRPDAIALAALYLMYPALGYANLYEFHPETLAIAPLLFAFRFAQQGRRRATLIAAAIALLTREDVALVVLALAAYLALAGNPQSRRIALPLAGSGVLSLLLTFAVLHPLLNTGGAQYAGMYVQKGVTVGNPFLDMLVHPVRTASALFYVPDDPGHTTAKLQFWVHLLFPLAFLPLLAPATLAIALPTLFEHLLSWRLQQHSIVYQYTALLTPCFMAAAVRGYARLRRVRPGRPAWALPALALGFGLTSQILFGPLFGRGLWQTLKPFEDVWPTPQQRDRAARLDQLVAGIPPQGGVVAGFEMLPRLASRDHLHSAHHVLMGHYTFSDQPYPMPRDLVAMITNTGDPTLLIVLTRTSGARLREMCAANDLHPRAATDETVLWTRGEGDTLELRTLGWPQVLRDPPVRFDQALAVIGWDSLPPRVDAGGTLTLRLGLKRVAPVVHVFPLRLDLIDSRGGTIHTQIHSMGYSMWPTHDWPADTTLMETVRFGIPRTIAPGLDTVALALQVGGGPTAGARFVDDPAHPGGDGRVRLGVVQITGGR